MAKKLNLQNSLKRFQEVYHGAENTRRKQLMERHSKRLPCERIPVYFSVPFDWSLMRVNLWMELLDCPLDVAAILRTTGEYPRELAEEVIAFQLEQRIFYIEHMPGDAPIRPAISTNFNILWVENHNKLNAIYDKVQYDLKTGDFHIEPFLNTEEDLEQLKLNEYHFDAALSQRRVALFTELTGGTFEIRDDIIGSGYLNKLGSPFEEACRSRGMMNLLMDMKDNPDFLHRLMKKLTGFCISRAEEMNRKSGTRNFIANIGGDDVNCQMFSPDDYREFIFPYELECSRHGSDYNYHSCGSLTPIYKQIAELQNLSVIHISPWSDIRTAVDVFSGKPVTLQKCMDTQRDILNKDDAGMVAQIDEMRSAFGSSIVEVACHCETADAVAKTTRFVTLARERLQR